MGFFGTFVYDGNDWYEVDPEEVPSGRLSPPFLWLDIHDSDVGNHGGTVFLGARCDPVTRLDYLRTGLSSTARTGPLLTHASSTSWILATPFT